ncbi:hypothetical protein BDW60DRAFT_202933 [Aspergillus nidulans var. acristatus]
MTTRQNDERQPNHTVDSADSICTVSRTTYLMTSLKHNTNSGQGEPSTSTRYATVDEDRQNPWLTQ